MSNGFKRLEQLAALVLAMTFLFSGCWDNQDLGKLFIAVGIAIDKSEEPDQIDVAVQVGENQPATSESGSGSPENPTLILRKTSSTIQEGMETINRDSNRYVLLEHNQVLLIGSELAEQGGIKQQLDVFLRNREARIEVQLLIAEGRGDEILHAVLNREENSGIYLFHLMENLKEETPYYRIRLFDFASRLRSDSHAPMVPIVKLEGEEKERKVQFQGMGIFKEDKLIGRLNNEETFGYLWAMGKMKWGIVTAQGDQRRAVFHISNLDTKRKVKVESDGNVKVSLSVDTTLSVEELRGFGDVAFTQQVPLLIEISQNKIREQIISTIKIAQQMQADIYGFGTDIYRKQPKEWEKIKDRWDEIFAEMEPEVTVKVHLPGVGQIMKSLEMEED